MTSCFAPASGSAYRGVASEGAGVGLPETPPPPPIVKGVPSLFSAGMLINQIFVSRCFRQQLDGPKYGSHRQHNLVLHYATQYYEPLCKLVAP